MIRLIGIDVDGTLVGSSGIVLPAVWAAADRARAKGIHLVLCSGRPAFGVALEYARRLDASGWHIFQNGASVVHLPSGRSRSVPLPPARVSELIREARATGELLELYNDSEIAVESETEWARVHSELLGVPFEPRKFESLAAPIVRAQWLMTPDKAALVMVSLPPDVEVALSTSPLMPDVRFVGFTNKGVSKGSAIRMIADEYGVALQDVMYVGDAGNDLPALRIVGHSVAMANASEEVRTISARTVGHVDAGGLAEALELAL